MKYFSLFFVFLFSFKFTAKAQERVDVTTCDGTGTGIVCVAPRDSLYKLCVKVTPGPCTNKTYTIDWGDNKTEKITLTSTMTVSHDYDLRNFIKNCSNGEFKVSIFVENAACPNDNKGFRVTFNKKPTANPSVTSACEGSSFSFNNNSCPTSDDVKFLWEFSDGRTSTSVNPYLSFTDSDKTYKLKLTSTSQNCGVDSKEIDFKLTKKPVARYTAAGFAVIAPDTVVCLSAGGVLTLDGTTSTEAERYNWQITGGGYSFQEKTTSNSDVVKIKLDEEKEYTIRLTVSGKCGNSIITRKYKAVRTTNLNLSAQPDACEAIKFKIRDIVPGAVYTLNGDVFDPSVEKNLPVSDKPYIVTASLTNACGAQMQRDTFSVAQSQPLSILFPSDTTLCRGSPDVLLKVNQTGGTWSSTSGVVVQSGQSFFSPATVGNYVVIHTKGLGKCLVADTVRIKVEGILVNAVSQTLCEGVAFLPLQATPSGGRWTTSDCNNCLKGDTLMTGSLTGNQVRLTYEVSSQSGCKASALATVTIGRPKANFDLPGGCSGETFKPMNKSVGASAYSWIIDNVLASSESSPQLALKAGKNIVFLVARAGSCADTLKKEVTITPPPSAVSFTPSQNEGCSPLNISFAVNGNHETGTDYQWSFGEGAGQYTGFQPVEKVFENHGKANQVFKITVEARNACGRQTSVKEITVKPKVKAEIGVDSTILRCTPAQLLFSNRSVGHNKPASKWTFGDGISRITGNDTVSHSFSARDSAKTYIVQLEVGGECGNDKADVAIQVYPTTVTSLFTISKSEVCPGETILFSDATVPKPSRWIWKFDDGTISTQANPTHRFAQSNRDYKVTLLAYTACGYDSVQRTIRTTEAPKGDFMLETPVTCEGQVMKLTNKSSPLLDFSWDFGDGSVDSLNFSPSYTYESPGNRIVTLSLYRDSKECKTEIKKTVKVSPPIVADFGAEGGPLVCSPGPVQLTNLSKNADSWTWIFSDGRSSTSENPALPFSKGQYSVKLIASFGGVCKDSVERVAAITVDSCRLDVPQMFSPNGDGIGDRYTFFGNGVQRIRWMKIRDRWGEIVFEMRDAPPGSQNTGESWDGLFKGNPMPAGMYVYEAQVLYVDNSLSDKLRGNIYLIR